LILGSLIRTAVIFGILAGITKAIRKPISSQSSRIIGFILFLFVTVTPIAVSLSTSGEMEPIYFFITLLFGIITGIGASKISYSMNREKTDVKMKRQMSKKRKMTMLK
jgi:hypothetical protein